MGTYVTSLRSNIAHYAEDHRPLCGVILRGPFQTTERRPPGAPLCAKCAVRHGGARARRARLEQRDAVVIRLLASGATDTAIRHRLNLGARTVSRYLNDAMRRAGARTRFEWGYRVGRAERRRK